MRVLDGDRLLRHSADLADGAVGTDRSRRRDRAPTGEVPAGERVDDPECEGEPGRRSADVVHVDAHVERIGPPGWVKTSIPMMRLPCRSASTATASR